MLELVTTGQKDVLPFAQLATTESNATVKDPFASLKYVPDDWQGEMVREMYDKYVYQGQRQFGFWIPTGAGKTIVQVMLAAVIAETIRVQDGESPVTWVYTVNATKFQWATEIGKIDPRIAPLSSNPTDIFVIDTENPRERAAQLLFIRMARQLGNAPKYVIASYETMRIGLADILETMGTKDIVMLDECDKIQDTDGLTGKAARALSYKAYVRAAASASMMYYRIDDLYAILQFLAPDEFEWTKYGKGKYKTEYIMPHRAKQFGDMGQFLTKFAIQNDNGAVVGVKEVPELHRRMAKLGIEIASAEEVLPNLPPLKVEIVQVELGPVQRQVYEMAVDGFLTKLDEMQEQWDSGENREMLVQHVLAHLTLVRRAASAMGPKQYLQLNLSRDAAKHGIVIPWKYSVEDMTDENIKLDWLRQYVLGEEDAPGGIIAYSQWKEPLKALEAGLADVGRRMGMGRYDGDATDEKREWIRQGVLVGNCRLLLCNNAGGRSLNLQQLNRVVALDIPWTPTELLQVQGRIKRRGQQNPMSFIYCVAANTIETARMLPRVLQAAKDQEQVQYGARGRMYESALGTDNLNEVRSWFGR